MLHTPKKSRHSRRRIIYRSFAAFIVVGLLATFGAITWSHRAADTVVHHNNYGVALGSSAKSWTPAQLDANLKRVQQLGVSSIRFDIAWSDLQQTDAQHFNWKPYDAIIASAQKHQLKSLVILDYTPKWARALSCNNSQMCPPANVSQFASYAAAVVARYQPKGVQDYEIWNEENSNQFWLPTANAAAYAKLLTATATSMRQQASNLTIITGGLSPAGDPAEAIAPRLFLKQLYAAGAKDSFDAVGFHPYTSPFVIGQSQAVNWSLMDSGTDNLRATMTINGDASKKIWVTEYGAATAGDGNGATAEVTSTNYDHVSESLQTDMARTAIASAQTKSWLGGFYWYTLLDGPKDATDRESHFGLIDAEGNLKPAYTEIQTQLSKLK